MGKLFTGGSIGPADPKPHRGENDVIGQFKPLGKTCPGVPFHINSLYHSIHFFYQLEVPEIGSLSSNFN